MLWSWLHIDWRPPLTAGPQGWLILRAPFGVWKVDSTNGGAS